VFRLTGGLNSKDANYLATYRQSPDAFGVRGSANAGMGRSRYRGQPLEPLACARPRSSFSPLSLSPLRARPFSPPCPRLGPSLSSILSLQTGIQTIILHGYHRRGRSSGDTAGRTICRPLPSSIASDGCVSFHSRRSPLAHDVRDRPLAFRQTFCDLTRPETRTRLRT
jgi:hypothetical protein